MACIGGKGDPNLYILLEFLVVRDGFLYLFLFNTKTIKIGAVEFGWLLLTMPGEQICISQLGLTLEQPVLPPRGSCVHSFHSYLLALIVGAQTLRALQGGVEGAGD